MSGKEMAESQSTGAGHSSAPSIPRERARLISFQLEVLATSPSDARDVLIREVNAALSQLEDGEAEYAQHLCDEVAASFVNLRRRTKFGLKPPEAAIGTVLAGVLVYSVLVLLVLGPCVVIVASLNAQSNNTFTSIANALGLMPVFETVIKLGIQPKAYMWGIFGGAGAVVSMVKRFDQLAQKSAQFWLLFGQGLFNPIVGSLSAVVVCGFVYHTDQLKALQLLPGIVVAFFSGFSERLLVRVESLVTNHHEGATKKLI